MFGDVSVKVEGEFRLRFSLFEMIREKAEVVYIRSIVSNPFKGKRSGCLLSCLLAEDHRSLHAQDLSGHGRVHFSLSFFRRPGRPFKNQERASNVTVCAVMINSTRGILTW